MISPGFCGKCGTQAADPGDTFCRRCGAPLSGAPALSLPPPQSRPRTPEPSGTSFASIAPVIVVVLIAFGFLSGLIKLPSSAADVAATVRKPPDYRTETVVVKAGQAWMYTFKSLDVGNILEGYFTIQGGNDDVGFQIQTPSGGYATNIARVSRRHDFSLKIPEKGPYTLVFNNGFSVVTDKYVTLVYRAY